MPHFDEDTRTLFLTGKGDAIVYTFEIGQSDQDLVLPLTSFSVSTPHQAISFLNKSQCNVRELEFARGFRLTKTSIEPFSFTLPRQHVSLKTVL